MKKQITKFLITVITLSSLSGVTYALGRHEEVIAQARYEEWYNERIQYITEMPIEVKPVQEKKEAIKVIVESNPVRYAKLGGEN